MEERGTAVFVYARLALVCVPAEQMITVSIEMVGQTSLLLETGRSLAKVKHFRIN